MLDNNRLLEIRTLPDETLRLWETNALWQQFNGLLHGILVVNRSSGPIRIDSVAVEVEVQDEVVRSWLLPAAGVRSAAEAVFNLGRQGVLRVYDCVFQLSRLVPQDIVLAQSEELEPNAGLVLLKQVIDLSAQGGALRVVARGHLEDGQEVSASEELRIATEAIAGFALPVRGTWFVRAGASFHTHHRWSPPDEFALDLVRCGASGATFKGSGAAASDHYAYGEDVLAAAPGEVVEAVGAVQEQTNLLQREDEDDNVYYARFGAASQEMLSENPITGLGNYIVIQHASKRFSCYAHLMHGSLRVHPGDHVEAGHVIAAVGQTGSSPSPHLHFKVCEGPDPLADPSLPVHFRNARVIGRPDSGYLHSGDLIQSM